MFGRTLINGSSVVRFPERGKTDDLFDRFNVAVMNGIVGLRVEYPSAKSITLSMAYWGH